MNQKDKNRNDCRLGHQKLEPRRMLNADFFLSGGGDLSLDNFVDTTPANNDLTISQSGSIYTLNLSDGVFAGSNSAGLTGAGTNTLSLDSSVETLTNLFLDSDTSDQFNIEFGDFDLAGDVTISNSAMGASFGAVTQQAGTQFTLSGTLNVGGADFLTLQNLDNDFNVVTIDNSMGAAVHDSNDINLGNITTISSGVLEISTGNDGSIQQLTGTSIVASGDAAFDADGTGIVGLMGDNDFQADVTAAGSTVELADRNDLSIDSITAVDDIRLVSGEGDGDIDGNGMINGTEVARTGGISLGDLTTTSANGQVFLETDDFVSQSATSVITTTDLLIQTDLEATSNGVAGSGGSFIELAGANQVDRLAASSDLAPNTSGPFEFQFSNSQDLEIANLTYTSVSVNSPGVSISGFDVQEDVRLRVSGNLTQQVGAAVVVTGNFGLAGSGSAAENISLIDADNDFNRIAINDSNAGGVISENVEIVDRNDVTISGIENGTTRISQVMIAAGAGGAGAINLAGNIDASNVLLQASTGAVQTSSNGGIIADTLLLGGDASSESTGNFILNGSNQVSALTTNLGNDLEFTNVQDLNVVKAEFELVSDTDTIADESFVGIVADGNLTLNITGSLYQSVPGASLLDAGAVIIGGDTFISASQDICLLGVDCDGDGVQDNSFTGDISLNAGSDIALALSGDLSITSSLVSGSGILRFIADRITIDTDIVADQLLLEANNGVVLNDLFFVDVTDLLLTGAGDFDFATGQGNVIDNIATDIMGNLSLTNSVDLNISNLTFASACGDVTICGVNVTGDFGLVLTDSSLFQDAAIVVNGLTTIEVVDGFDADTVGTGTIWLTGADCDGDGVNDNDLGSLVIVSATNAEVVDGNDLTVNGATVTSQLWLGAGAGDATPGDNAGGTLTLDGNITAGSQSAGTGQILLQASEGVTQSSGLINTNQLLLGGDAANESTGDFNLTQANTINELAASLVDSLSFVNSTDVAIVKGSYVSVCDPAQSESFAGLDVGDDLIIDVTVGDLIQTDGVVTVDDVTTLSAAGTIWLTGADCDGDGDVETLNDFNSLVVTSAANAEILDGNDLTVTSVSVAGQLWLGAGAGDVTPGDGVGGTLTLDGNIIAGSQSAVTGQILLQASEGVTQSSGIIDTNQLLLGGDAANESTGEFDLQQSNTVNELAASLIDSLSFVNATDLTIVKATYVSVCDPTQSEDFGLDGNMDLVTGLAGLNVGDDLTLDIDGDLGQTDGFVVVGLIDGLDEGLEDVTTLTASGNICLVGADCDGDGVLDTFNDFQTLEIVSAANAEVVDANDFTVTGATVDGQLRLAAGEVVAGMLTLDGNITAGSQSAGTGQILLQASNGVEQSSGIIDTNQLLLGGDAVNESTGDFTLDQANRVNELAATLNGSLWIVSATDLTVTKAEFESVCDTDSDEAFDGIVTGSGLSLDVMGDLDQSDGVVIVGGAATLTATGNICLVGADCVGDDGVLDTFNDFQTLEIVSAANAEIVDANDLTVTGATVDGQLRLAAGEVGAGMLMLDGNITAGSQSAGTGQVLLQASNGVEQDSGIIDTNQLLLGGDAANESTGDFILNQANTVNELAASLIDSLSFVNATDLTIVKATYVSVCDPTQSEDFGIDGNLDLDVGDAGLNIGDDLTLNVIGDLDQSGGPVVVGLVDGLNEGLEDVTTLTVTGNICLVGADCVGDGVLDTFNDFQSLNIVTAANAEVVDANDFTVLGATVSNQLFLRAGEVAPGMLTLDGNVIVGSQVLLQASNGVDQIGGGIITNDLLVGGNETDEGTGLFDLTQNNQVNRLTGNLGDGTLQFVNESDLEVTSFGYTFVCNGGTESFDSLTSMGAGEQLENNIVVDEEVFATIQTEAVETGSGESQFVNGNFDGFLNGVARNDDTSNADLISVAIQNTGTFVNNVEVNASRGDILIQTLGANSTVSIEANVQVSESIVGESVQGNILVVAADDFQLVNNAQLARGTFSDISDSLESFSARVLNEFDLFGFDSNGDGEITLEELDQRGFVSNPGFISNTLSLVDAVTLNQSFVASFGNTSGAFAESQFDLSVFFGVSTDQYDRVSLDVAETNLFTSLTASQQAEWLTLLSPTLGDNPVGPQSLSFFQGLSTTENFEGTSQPDAAFTMGDVNGTESFSSVFLNQNPEFRNVFFVFNDANINIFENADGSGNLVDLNVSVEDFEGSARIGQPAQVQIAPTAIEIPDRIEVRQINESAIVQDVAFTAAEISTSQIEDKFFQVVYFKSQYEADLFQAKFEAASEEAGFNSADLQDLIKELDLEENVDFFKWKTGEGTDLNEIRNYLETLDLDLDDALFEDKDNNGVADWIDRLNELNELEDELEDGKLSETDIPRGVYKIIEIEDGVPTIPSDDIDRRFVPEKEAEDQNEDDSDKGLDQNDEFNIPFDSAASEPVDVEEISPRIARWSAILRGEEAQSDEPYPVSSQLDAEALKTGAVVSTGGLGLLAMFCSQKSKGKKSINEEVESFSREKSENPDRNVFSSAARFRRRHEQSVANEN